MEQLENVSEDEFEEKISNEVEKAGDVFAEQEKKTWGALSPSWNVASGIVKKVKPVPWIFWVMIRTVYGRGALNSSKTGNKVADPMTFSMLENLIMRAVQDSDLSQKTDPKTIKNLTAAVNILGTEVTASLCFIHSVCMRVSRSLNDRMYRAIIDDALIRARLGILLGHSSKRLEMGKPLLAGFAGRAGLAVQLASGSEQQARKALNSLASGKDISKMGFEVYGCDPLQVAALTLIAAGCHQEIAFGVASFSLPSSVEEMNSEQELWLNMFSTLEYIRVNKLELITDNVWADLGFSEVEKEDLLNSSQNVFRNGHQLDWLTSRLSQMI